MTTTPPEPQQPHQPYGAYPTAPAGGREQAPPAPPQPPSIAMAVKLMWVGAALSALSLVYSLSTMGGLKDDIAREMIKADPDVEQSFIDAMYGVAIGFAVVFGLLGALLWVWMAWKNGQGRGWARVVATVLGGLNLLGLLFTAGASSTDAVAAVSAIASVVLAGIILILLWRKESSQFYEATAASRRLY